MKDEIFIPIKNKEFVLDKRDKIRVYVYRQNIIKYLNKDEYDDIQKYVKEENFNIKVNFDINPLDRLIAIKDYYKWLEDNDFNASHVFSLISYENFLKSGEKKYDN